MLYLTDGIYWIMLWKDFGIFTVPRWKYEHDQPLIDKCGTVIAEPGCKAWSTRRIHNSDFFSIATSRILLFAMIIGSIVWTRSEMNTLQWKGLGKLCFRVKFCRYRTANSQRCVIFGISGCLWQQAAEFSKTNAIYYLVCWSGLIRRLQPGSLKVIDIVWRKNGETHHIYRWFERFMRDLGLSVPLSAGICFVWLYRLGEWSRGCG